MVRGVPVKEQEKEHNYFLTGVPSIADTRKRNKERFPEDFMFQLSDKEFAILKSQIVISRWGVLRRANPYAADAAILWRIPGQGNTPIID